MLKVLEVCSATAKRAIRIASRCRSFRKFLVQGATFAFVQCSVEAMPTWYKRSQPCGTSSSLSVLRGNITNSVSTGGKVINATPAASQGQPVPSAIVKASRLEELGSVLETKEQHLARHAGGRKDCARCRFYLQARTWITEENRCSDKMRVCCSLNVSNFIFYQSDIPYGEVVNRCGVTACQPLLPRETRSDARGIVDCASLHALAQRLSNLLISNSQI